MDIDIVPNKCYDPAKAKIYANLRWLFAKAYGTDSPDDLMELFYVDQYEQEHIKPLVLQLLLSGELYCSVCSLILKGFKTPQSSAISLHSHQAVIKALLRRGIHVVEADEYVSDYDLSSVPIKMSAHITLIDALMTAYASERVSTDRVVSSCGRFSNPGAFSQGPLDLENALVSWINKVIIKMREISVSEQMRKEHLPGSYSYQTSPSKWYWTLVPGRCRDSPEGNPYHFPLVDDLMNNIFTATALLTLIHFYCPALIRLEDICLKEIPPIAETISNIQLLMAFSNKHLNRGFYLKIEDMLYCPPALKNNMMSFVAELFWVFEKVKPNFVQPRDSQEMKDGTASLHNMMLYICNFIPVSRPLYYEEPYSLHTPPFEGAGFSLALASMDPHQTHQGYTTPSLPRHQPGAGLKGLPGRCKAQGLLGHVYISDEENEVEEEELVVIIHPPLAAGQQRDGAPDDALPHGAFSVDHLAQESFYLEPLVPAVSKPAKEKSICLNKQDESGETPRIRSNIYTNSSPATQRPDKPETKSLDLRATFAIITPTQSENEDKEDNRCSSPCLSTMSQASSSCCSASDSNSVRMTTFADRKLKKKNLKNCSSSPTCSSQKTKPDKSAITFPPPLPQGGSVYARGDHKSCWQGKESLGGFVLEKEGGALSPPAVCSELVQLHMQLVEQQRAIEGQKKKMETVFTQQRLELGKAAFLNVIKKGGGKSDTLPRPLKKSPEPTLPFLLVPDEPVIVPSGPVESDDEDKPSSSEKGDPVGEEMDRVKSDVIEVDISDQNGADASNCHVDNEQKNGLGFFYKHEEKAEDEMAKRRAAFLLKQERKAEEARLRKQQQEAENELKRDEARLKAEEDRVRKEEEKIRRELIKQEYLQRKQQELLEEQGAVKPRPKSLSTRRPRLKSPQHPSSNLPKASSRDEPSSSQRGSTLSLAAEPDEFTSGRSQRLASVWCSEDSFSVMSVDWDKRSTASFSLTTDYNGPKLFKEPTSKSNKTIIINAIAHCCLAGKVNESQKNVVLEELEKCKANHLLILLRDGSCQYRGIYCYLTDTEDIIKFLGTGPRTITRKMIDKLFKYSCDRKQFGVIPTKTLSITVDALTIHNHLWQVKRKGSLTMKK
ncbi:unnamed protein product [Lota lota]